LVEVKQQRKAFGGGKAHRQQATPEQVRREYRATQPRVARRRQALGCWNTIGSAR
jgi:hypothetical protein